MFNKKGIGPVVATALLLVVAVVGVVNFQTWYNSYQQDTFTNVEMKSNSAQNGVTIEIISGSNLYVKNNLVDNLTVTKIKLNDKDCNVTVNLTINVMNTINLGTCVNNLTSKVQLVTLFTSKGIVEKSLYLKDVNPVSISGGALSGLFSGYAWGENTGYISFSGTGYNVSISNNNLVGYAYGENTGFISFNGTNYNVSLVNSYLVGFAYSENTGFISFNGTNYNVSLVNSYLVGNAWSENMGYIQFNSTGFYNITYY